MMMRVGYLTANQAWVITFGDQLLDFDGKRFFPQFADVLLTLRKINLKVDGNGYVISDGPNPYEETEVLV